MRRIVALLFLVALAATSCSDSGDSDELVVGALYPTSGPQAEAGIEELRGVRLAVEYVNLRGGINGRQLKLVTADAPTPESARGALHGLVGRGAKIVLGSHSSAVSAAVAKASLDEDVVFFETGAVGQVDAAGAGGRSFFRLSPMGANLGKAAVTFVGGEVLPDRPLRWAVAYVDDTYGKTVGDGAVAEVKRRGFELAGVFPYDAHRFDPADVAARISAAAPDALFVSAYLDDGVALRKAVVNAGVKTLAEIGTSSSYCHPAFGAALGAQAVGLFASDKPDAADVKAEALTDEGRKTLEWVRPRYEARHRAPMASPGLSGFSSALAVLDRILRDAESTSPDRVRAAALAARLPEGSLPNGSGLELAPEGAVDAGDNRGATSVIWQWVAEGVRAVVWPPAYATSPVVR